MDAEDEHLQELAYPVCAALVPPTIAPGEANAGFDGVDLKIFCNAESLTEAAPTAIAKQEGARKKVLPRYHVSRATSSPRNDPTVFKNPAPSIEGATTIHHVFASEDRHLSTADPVGYFYVLRADHRGCQGTQNHSQGTLGSNDMKTITADMRDRSTLTSSMATRSLAAS
jgi:hypothetical protein